MFSVYITLQTANLSYLRRDGFVITFLFVYALTDTGIEGADGLHFSEIV